MNTLRFSAYSLVCLFAINSALADHASGPNGGKLVKVGSDGFHVELIVEGGELVTAKVLDKNQKPVSIDAKTLTFTFTEPDGEKEDYAIEAIESDSKGSVFQRKGGHVVNHVVRDKMSITLSTNGKKHSSETFAYGHGPNGGDLFALGDSGMYAELSIKGDFVRVYILNQRKRPAKVDAKKLVLTFIESDGEKEDYGVSVKDGQSKGTLFEREDDHVVEHIMRDKTMISVDVNGKKMSSKSFKYGSK